MKRTYTLLLLSVISYYAKAQSPNFIYDRAGSFKDGMAPVYKGNNIGFIDKAGKEVVPVIYEEDYIPDEFTDGVAIVTKNGLSGLIDKTGKLIVACEYKKIGEFSEGVAEAYKENGKVGFIDKQGKAITPFQYGTLILFGGVKCVNGMIPVENNSNKKGYIDKTGKLIVPFKYETVYNFSDGLGMVRTSFNGKVSYVNTKGEIAIPEKYDDGTMFKDGLAYVNKGAYAKSLYSGLQGGKWGVIDKSGKEIIPTVYDHIYEIKNGLTVVSMGSYPNEKKGLIGRDGKMILPVEYYDIKILKGRLAVNKVFIGPYALFDYAGKQLCDYNLHLYDIFPEITEGLLRVQELKNNTLGKAGAVDENGVLKIPMMYDAMTEFSDGLSTVAINKKYGAIDKTGKTVIPLQYDGMSSFSEGWAIVYQNKKYGFINKAGKLMDFSKPAAPEPVKTTNTNTTTAALLLDENFDNNDKQWGVWDNDGASAQLYNGNYRFTVKNSNNYLSWYSLTALATDQSKDFAIETKILLNSKEAGNAYDSYWLLWGLGNNGKSYYAFGIYPEGKFQYGKNVNGSWDGKAGAISNTAINAGVGKANVLRVEKKKDNVLFFINGIEVHRTTYEPFNTMHSGIGFQVNNKMQVDIDYLKVYQGTASAASSASSAIVSPQPYESDYQNKISLAGNSNERADAIINYYLALKSLNYTEEQKKSLLGEKFIQMMEIDYYGFYNVLMSKKINLDDVKLIVKASEVLTAEQRAAIKAISVYTVEDFTATQNNTTRPVYPAGVPKPGYGWGKTVSSDKTTYTNTTKPAVVTPPPVNELAALQSRAYNLQGAMVYVGNTNYYVPKYINITGLDDEITLTGIGANYTYSSYYGRNEFGIKTLKDVTRTIKVKELVRMIDNVSGAYIVTEIGPCGKCAGQASSWDNQSRTRTYCTSCNATGCVPKYIWNNGSSRQF
jgi:hypothetical protein